MKLSYLFIVYAATCILQIIFAMEKILDLEIKKSEKNIVMS